jgi:presenilin-like A22 family membrane protease
VSDPSDDVAADGDGAAGEAPGADPEAAGSTPEDAPERSKAFELAPAAGVFALFTLTVVGGLALVVPFREAGLQAFENPSSLSNVGLIVVEVVVATALFLLAFRYDLGETIVRVFVVGSFAYVLQYPLAVFLDGVVPASQFVAVGFAVCVAAVLWVYPEWYVLDAGAVMFGAAAIALFGASLAPLPVVVLLVVMAAYDAYSVYVSEHMQSLGGGIVDLKLPMVFVVPAERGFSMLDVDDLEGLASGAHLLGLGDAMFPGLLAASGAVFLSPPEGPAEAVLFGLNGPALGALVGSLVGMVALNVILFRFRRTHAGLPALNAGVIGGYLVGAVVAGVPVVEALGLGPYL